jgi:aminoglycoside phosphotransferase family enzyme
MISFTPLDALLYRGFVFQVDSDLKSPATRVMFDNSNQLMEQICLKMWLECNNAVYQTEDPENRTKYLLEGLQFNRRFAPDVYPGIVPILTENAQSEYMIKCGPLIRNPESQILDFSKPYALVMKRLKEEWRLDHQLLAERLGNEQGMEFLARELADMHCQFEKSSAEKGTPGSLFEKLELNQQEFQIALDHLQNDFVHYEYRKRNGDWGIDWFRSVGTLLKLFAQSHLKDFEQRCQQGHIRRCHGDLKASNLWVFPPTHSPMSERRLVPSDCVDFNPEFCNIDTLSDAAMLAVDLEMRLAGILESENKKNNTRGRQLARHFVDAYLKAFEETEAVRPILEYYITEKAIVCSYMSILFDGLPTLGEKYLDVVMLHSQKLVSFLSR